MKRATKITALLLTLFFVFGTFPAAQTAFAAQLDSEEVSAGVVTVNVTADELSVDACGAIQQALSLAEDDASGATFYKVVVEPGSYDLYGALVIHSNTCLSLNGVTLRRAGTANMLLAGGDRYDAEGYCYRNITIEGGVFDGNAGSGTMIKLGHAKNVLLKNVTVMDNRNSHMIEAAGIDGFTVTGCTFTDQISANKDGYEAIQLDVLKSPNFEGYRSEDLSMRNVLVEDCAFINCPRGVGSHTAVLNNPHRNIIICNNMFSNMASVAIEGYNWVDCRITGNVIDTAPRAIALYTAGDGTYTSASIAAEGGTEAHYEDVKPNYWTNGFIENNVITNSGVIEDKYERGRERSAISVMGVNITGGSIPAGEYTCINVAVKHNIIQMKGNGIRAEYARNLVIEGNEIKSLGSANSNDYGVVVRNNTTNTYINKNYMTDIPVNGIQIADNCNIKRMTFNEIYRTGKYGVGIYGSNVSLINNNEIRDTQSDGILAHSGAYVEKISENRLMRTGSTAIHITLEASAGTIEKNTAYRCSGNQPGGNNYTTAGLLTAVTPTDNAVTLAVGEKYRVSKTLSPVNSLYDFSYSSSNTNVVTVDGAGLVTALKDGSATVTATATNGKKCTVTVTVFTAATATIFGDLDRDGFVTDADYATLSGYLAEQEGCAPADFAAADVNADGAVNVRDRIILARYLDHAEGYEALPKNVAGTAVNGGELTVSSASANVGETAEIEISSELTQSVANLTFAVTYDDSVLELIGAEDAAEFATAEPHHALNEDGACRFTWVNDWTNAAELTEGALVTLTFRVKDGAEEGVSEVSVVPETIVSYDKNLNPVLLNAEAGSVEITRLRFSISGTVTGGSPENAATVELRSKGEETPICATATDEDGAFAFDGVLPGEYTLTVSKEGCAGAEVPVSVVDSSPAADIALRLIGDLNRDGIIGVEDATVLQRYLAEYVNADGSPIVDTDDPVDFRVADYNADGVIDIRDVTEIQRILAEYN